MEQGEIAFWVFVIGMVSLAGYFFWQLDRDKKKSKKS